MASPERARGAAPTDESARLGGHGCRVRWHRPATAGGEAVLLLHGSESHAGWFDDVARELAERGYTACAPDRPGWGMSGGPRGRLDSAADAVSFVHAARNLLVAGHDRVHLAGVSWGGLLAAAAADAGRFASATLVSPALWTRRRLPWPDGLAAAWSWVIRDFERRLALPIAPADFAADPDLVARVAADGLRTTAVSAGFYRATLQIMATARRGLGRAGASPTRILLAAADPLIDVPRTMARAAARGVGCEVVPGTRHALTLEAPRAVTEAIVALAGATGRAATP